MRKLLWCCSAAGVLAAGSLFSTAYLACHYPNSAVGRGLTAAANTSIAMQPISGLATLVAHATQQAIDPHETACTAGSAEECVPDDPQPIVAGIIEMPVPEPGDEPASIIINEDDPLPGGIEVQALPSTIEIDAPNDQANNVCPMFMPYCNDDGEAPATPKMPCAEGNDKKQTEDASEESDDNAYKAWMKLFETADKEKKSPPGEELPPPREEASDEPKCQEDSHLHEHYSGCPHTTCPYTGKSYPSCSPTMKSGKEEVSEEPPMPPAKHGKKIHKSTEKTPHAEGIDTMEYRPSDGGLNEYGPGPM